MITITDDKLDAVAGELWLTDVRNHQYDPENVSPLKVHRVAVERMFTKAIADMISSVWTMAYSRGNCNYQELLRQVRKEMREV